MTTNIEFDAVSNSWDEHTSAAENHISTGVQVAQATTGQAASEPVPVDVGSGAPAQGGANAPAANAPASNAAQGNAPAGNAPAANAAATNVPHEYHAEAGNVVKLPANVSIDNIKVEGHNLVLVQPDGSEIVIKDGALNVPTFILGDVEVPRVALIAALEASHVDVAFGADGSISAGGNGSPSSAGGNFEQPAGGIGDGFGLTALLPPTDLAFGQPEHRELFPGLLPDSTPMIGDLNPETSGGDTIVNEKGLPASSGSEGSGEQAAPGPDGDPSEHNTGTFTITSPDGIGSVSINGQVISGAALADSANVHVNVTTPLGTLTITGYDAGTGQVSYTYTLEHSDQHPDGNGTNSTFDNITVIVTDTDGDVSLPGTLSVRIVDDVPTANPDANSVTAGSHAEISGNVITGAGETDPATSADVKGADGASVTSAYGTGAPQDVTSAVTGTTIAGQYGTLTLYSDGHYTYDRAANTPGGVSDVFHYTLTDGDGDQSSTTLTINIGNEPPKLGDIPAAGADGAIVNEAGLASGTLHDGSNTTSGTIGFTSQDGVNSVSLGGHTLSSDSGNPTTFTDPTTGGTVSAWYEYNSATGAGTIHYSYTLTTDYHSATGGDDANIEATPTFAVVVTDQDSQTASGNLVVHVVDDVPTAANDGPYTVVEDGAGAPNAPPTSTVSGDVLANDASGADTPKSFVSWSGADAAAITALNTYGTLTQNANGTWSYVLDNSRAATQALTAASNLSYTLHYTMQDADGDTSSATLTINVTGADDTASVVTASAQGPDNTVYEAGLNPNGSNAASNTETSTGSFTIAASDGIQDVVIGGTTFTLAQIQAFNGTQTVNTGEGILTLTGYSGDAHSGTISYSYTLSATIDNDSKVPSGNDTVDGSGFNDSVALTVHGAGGTTASDNLVVHVVDDVPTAANDTWGSPITGPTTLTGLLNNDVFGADGVATTTPGVITTTNGAHGTVVYNNDGTFTYTPTGVYVGSDTFTYTIKDGDGDTSTATVTVNVNTNTVPTGGGTASLTVNEAALDTTLDATAPADLQPGVVTGTDPSSRGETAQASSGITFSSTGEAITVAFANPTGDPNWVAPTVSGLAAGYSISWALVGGQLVGTLMHGVTNLGPSLYLALSNTSAGPNSTLTPVVTATLTDQLQHTAGSGNITINGLQVVATDTSGDHVSGAVNLTVIDDAPLPFTPDAIFVDNATHSALTEQINFGSHAGADGVGDVVFNVANGGAVTDTTGLNVYLNGEQVFFSVVNSHTIEGRTSVANGSDLAFTATLDPITDTWTYTQNGSLFAGNQFNSGSFTNPGGSNNLAIVLDGPNATQNDLLVTANGNNTVNTNNSEFGVDGGNSIGPGETIRFDFVQNATTDGTVVGSNFSNHYEVSSFTSTVDTGGGSAATLMIRGVNADNDHVYVGDGDEGTAQFLTVTVADHSNNGLTPVVTYNANGTITLTNIGNGDTFTVTASSDAFSAMEITGLSGTNTFKLSSPLFTTASAATPFDIKIPVVGTDGDGDSIASSVTAKLSPDASTWHGTSGADTHTTTATETSLFGEDGNDVLNGLANQADTLAGGRGDDTLSGGSGDDSLYGGSGNDILIGGTGVNHLTGGSGNDTFVIDPSKLTLHVTDVIADYTPGQDVIDLSDLLQSLGGNAPTTDAQTGAAVNVNFSNGAAHVMVDDNGTAAGGNMVEVATLTNVGVNSAITILYDHTHTHTENVT
ncbi:putative Outer membrane adhesin like proteiin [Mesorhizobium sp. SOD10]|nr:putative Outer membrane adhesin like proteiin [Mesorhizobium sp. SOD10]